MFKTEKVNRFSSVVWSLPHMKENGKKIQLRPTFHIRAEFSYTGAVKFSNLPTLALHVLTRFVPGTGKCDLILNSASEGTA